MAKGSPIRTMRFTEDLSSRIEECIERRNKTTANEPWDFSAFVRQAIEEKLRHMERSRHSHSRPAKEVVYEG